MYFTHILYLSVCEQPRLKQLLRKGRRAVFRVRITLGIILRGILSLFWMCPCRRDPTRDATERSHCTLDHRYSYYISSFTVWHIKPARIRLYFCWSKIIACGVTKLNTKQIDQSFDFRIGESFQSFCMRVS